jgi:OOP family OmpA-OmpF porin
MKSVFLKLVCSAALSGAIFGLAACESATRDLAQMHAPAGLYQKTLFNEYRDLSKAQEKEGDWKEAKLFATKALAVHEGGKAAPSNPADYKLSRASRSRANAGLKRLRAAVTPKTIDAMPYDAAHAQTMYDCWLDRLEEKHGKKPERCEREFRAAAGRLEKGLRDELPALPVIDSYEIYFDWNKADIREDAAETIRRIAEDAKTAQPADITITGHSDRSGSEKANEKMAQRRALAVSDALHAQGVSAHVIDEKSSGELDAAVPTEDDERLEANRRVVIEFRK